MTLNDISIYSTRDIYLAATLISLKFQMLGIDYQIEGEKRPIGFFKFERTTPLIEAEMKFDQSLLSVEPKLFVTNLNSLKAKVIGAFNNPHNNIVEEKKES